MKGLAALAGFALLALLPSYFDWQQSPDKRGQFLVGYAAALGLIYLGVLRPS